MNFDKLLESENLPMYLYHATFKYYEDSIKRNGLIPRYYRTWNDKMPNAVFLADNKDEAISYTETTDNPNIPDSWFDNIIVFKVKATDLDKSKLKNDTNNKSDSTYMYLGTIDKNKLKKA